jgi:hypothetical protein
MKKPILIVLALCFLGLGGISAYLSGRVMCILGKCILVTEGSDIFTARGQKIDQGTATLIEKSSIPLFVVGGALLVAGLVIPAKETGKN